MSNVEQQPLALDLITLLRSRLASYLGTFADGRQAIWVEPPQSPKVGTGLHVFIERHYTQLSNEYGQWRVTFVLHGDRAADDIAYEANLQKFDGAIQEMRRTFPKRREVAIPFREDLPPQVSFLVCVANHYTKPMLVYS